MKKYVVYFGIVFIKNKNAAFHRASSICKSISALGYTPILVGMNDGLFTNTKGVLPNGQLYYEVGYPQNTRQWLRSLIDVQNIISVLDDIQAKNIKNVIVADYRFFPMLKIKKYCKKNNINFTIDVYDWFLPQPFWSFHSLIKGIDNFMRLKLLYPCVDRKICISYGFWRMYKRTSRLALIPGTIDPEEDKWNCTQYIPSKNKITLSFAGRPGKHCEKEKIDWILQAILELKDKKIIEFYIAGVTKDDFVNDNPNLRKYVECEQIHFLGSLSHEECIQLITHSDFSVLIRRNNKLSNYGFSTKISESFACGTPIIATKTSDVCEYIIEGENGYLCECTYESVKKALEKICSLDSNVIFEMHQKTKQNNPLIYFNYNDELRKVL